MAKTRTQKALYNTVTSLCSEIISLVCGLILPRLILANYGSAYNGISSSASQLLSAVSILTVGITGATRIALYRSLADQDAYATSRIIRATELYMRKVGYVLLIILFFLIIFYPLIVDTGYSWGEVAPLIVAAGIGAAGQFFLGMTYSALLMADQCIYISNIFLIISNVLNVLLSMILIRAGNSIQVVRISSSFILLLNPVMKAVYVRYKYKLDRNCPPDNSAIAMRKDVMAHSIANIVHDHTDIIVLTVFCNVKIVSVYTIYNLVMNALKKTQTVFTSGTEAIFGNMWVRGEDDKIKEYLTLFEYIICVFVSIVFSTSLAVILPFISLYTKNVKDVEYILPVYAAVITSAQMFYAFRAPYLAVIHGAGHYKQTKNGAYAEAIINLSLSIIFVNYFGIVGVAIGTLVANIFRTAQYAIYIEKNLVSRGGCVFAVRIAWVLANIFLVLLAISALQIQQYAYLGWKQWIIAATLSVTIAVVITCISSLIMYKKDFWSLVNFASSVLRRRVG